MAAQFPSLQALDQVKATILDMAINFGPKLLVAIVIIVAGYLAARWAAGLVERLLAGFRLESNVQLLLVRISRIVVIGLFAIMALQNLGVELLPLIAGLGVAGAGVALAMQGILGNMVAGLSIIFTRPFLVGHYISIAREEGVVLDISLFNTTLGHTDRSKVVIPNRKIVGEILHNYGKIRQLSVEVTLAMDADLAAAQAAIQDVLRANARVLKDPAPAVLVNRLAGGVSVFVGPWVGVPDYGSATSEVNQAILEAFRLRGVAAAVPQREVRMLAARG